MSSKEEGKSDDPFNAKTVGFDYKMPDGKQQAKESEPGPKENKPPSGQTAFKFEPVKKKKLFEDDKVPGWGGLNEKYIYTDRNVQDLVVLDKEVVAAANAALETNKQVEKSAGAFKRPQHKAKVHFKPSEALVKEAAKMNEYFEKLVIKVDDEGKQQQEKSATEDAGKEGKACAAACKTQATKGAKTNVKITPSKATKVVVKAKKYAN